MPAPQVVAIVLVALYLAYIAITLYRGHGSIARAYRRWGIPASVRRAIALGMMGIGIVGLLGILAADFGFFPATPVAG